MDGSSEKKLELFDVGQCEEAYQMGFLIGQRFSDLIQSRVATDPILQQQLLPFARTAEAQPLVEALCTANRQMFPRYWDEMLGTAAGSGIPILQIILLNFRKEILPFLLKKEATPEEVTDEDCSDVLVVNDSMAIAAHNEDATVALIGRTYLVRATLSNGVTFTAYTYAGELPTCAFGFNSCGLAFTLNSVPPTREEISAGGIGRNFISRDLLEATGLGDALNRIHSSNASVGHSYNLMDARSRRILNVETASGNRCSVHEVGRTPFFHANMYLHLQVQQVQDENSISRHNRAAQLSADSKAKVLSILGDSVDKKYPIYMTGPTLYTLCTALIDLDEQTITIYEGNPEKEIVSYALPLF
ncbi:acyl-coenzyme A:6-aminopenicillanic-acid-acyltransferase 40 kDa form-like [Phoenix dactylifera]|uniref:Acyl-coenzyme A:6-aminopenicillanic-acid-acyltransferase 40 kDa form-like n=1 Tax=Phoenix dactylifera TaxID=42345 RepID=A0A8B7C8F5_PHODC|nr:acyl-coenzyme A:6-aminopenicillanic-acid-acyltransferase 40 kDa form-like [Phoenix dactylifera]